MNQYLCRIRKDNGRKSCLSGEIHYLSEEKIRGKSALLSSHPSDQNFEQKTWTEIENSHFRIKPTVSEEEMRRSLIIFTNDNEVARSKGVVLGKTI